MDPPVYTVQYILYQCLHRGWRNAKAVECAACVCTDGKSIEKILHFFT